MRFVQDVLIVVLKGLIAIGDLVLLIFFSAINFVKKITGKASKTFGNLHSETKNNFKKISSFRFPRPKLTKFLLPKRKLSVAKKAEIFSAPKARSIQSFSFPKRKRGPGRPKKPFFAPVFFRFKYFFFGAIFAFSFIFLPILSIIFINSLPNPRQLVTQDVAQSTKIYDRNGSLLYQIYANQDRTLVPLSEIPDNLRNATIAIEDKNFYNSSGIDLLAILRSAIADIKGEPLQGGSTITQQLVKSRLLTPERSIERKIKEVVLAIWAQRLYTKNQILEMYFNQVPYGGTAWGAQAASQTYFGANVKDLDLAQSAFLAGLPQAPSIYSPYSGNGNLWKGRQEDVLSKMVSLGYITEEQKQKAISERLTFQPPQHVLHAPYFVMYVRNFLERKYGVEMVERGGLNVITSLDLPTQATAENIVSDEVNRDAYLNIHNGASLITNPKNGDILAMVGGKDYYDPNGGNFNVTTAQRQPGSTIKVITYTAALMQGYTAATTILDAPVAFAEAGSPPYAPVNYDGKFHGNLTLRQALGNSVNIPAVKTLNSIGIDKMVGLAKAMGITTWGDPSQYGLALTLGAAEVKMTDMAQVYGILANQGKRVDINPILKITDSQGNILEEKNTIQEKEVVPSGIAYIMSNILQDNSSRALEFGPNSPLVIPGHTVSVKTGTTDNKRDNWTIGYTPSYVVAVWVGNNDNSPLNPSLASGITGAAPIWHQIMQNLLGKSSANSENYPQPPDVVSKPCAGRIEYFLKGTENSVSCRIAPSPSPTPKP